MALSNSVIIARYQGILRREPTAEQVASLKGLYATEEALDTALLTTAVATVNPIVFLYQSAFGRVPDAEGLDYWVTEFNGGAGWGLDEIGDRFYDTDEWNAIFDQNQPALIIQQLYQNILGRTADTEGLNYWVNAYNKGEFTLAQIAVRFAVSDELTEKLEPAAADFLLDSANNDGATNPEQTLWDFVPPAPEPGPEDAFELTAGLDKATLAAGQDVVGGTNEYTDGDHIIGTEDNTAYLTLNGGVQKQVQLENIDTVVLRSGQGAVINTAGWTGTETVQLVEVDADVTLDDLQSTATLIDIVDSNDPDATLTFNYDGSKIGNNGVANLAVSETYATVKVGISKQADKAIEVINLEIRDSAETGDSDLTDLIGHKTTELNITGGYAGGEFRIKGELDETLEDIDASSALSNLDLNVSDTFTELTVLLGAGDDVLRTGDTLSDGDVIDGGAGENKLTADFVTNTDPNRSPTITNIQTVDVSFNVAENGKVGAPIHFDFSNVDDVETINLFGSLSRADFDKVDSTVTTLNIKGATSDGAKVVVENAAQNLVDAQENLAEAQAARAAAEAAVNLAIPATVAAFNAAKAAEQAAVQAVNAAVAAAALTKLTPDLAQGVEIDYDGKEFASLDINIEGETAEIGNAGNSFQAGIRVINADSVTVRNTSEEDVVVHCGLQVDDTFVGRFTTNVEIYNDSSNDLIIEPLLGSAIKDGDTIIDLKIQSTNGGTIFAGGQTQPGNVQQALLEEASHLNSLVVESTAPLSNIQVGVVGNVAAASDLEEIILKADVASAVRSYGVIAHGATVTDIQIAGKASSSIELLGARGTVLPSGSAPNNYYYSLGNNYDPNLPVGAGSNWLAAASVGKVAIDVGANGDVSGAISFDANGRDTHVFNNLIGFDLTGQANGSSVIVTGNGNVTGLWFEDEVIDLIDVQGLKDSTADHFITAAGFDVDLGADVAGFLNLGNQQYNFAVVTTYFADNGFTFLGSASRDFVLGTNENDTFEGGNGNDYLIGNLGDDVLLGGNGHDILIGDDAQYGASVTRLGFGGADIIDGGADIIDGGAGDDIIIGGGNGDPTRSGGANDAKGRDILTGGLGRDKFVFNFDNNHQGIASESGKSTLQPGSVYNDIITDFTTGEDQLVIDVNATAFNTQALANDYLIALFNGDDASLIGNVNIINTVNVIIRVGEYNADGTFNYVENGPDAQVLFRENAEMFGLSVLNGSIGEFIADQSIGSNAGTAYQVADHEIALLGAADTLGSLSLGDIVFV